MINISSALQMQRIYTLPAKTGELPINACALKFIAKLTAATEF